MTYPTFERIQTYQHEAISGYRYASKVCFDKQQYLPVKNGNRIQLASSIALIS